MTDNNILNDLELLNKESSKLRDESKEFVEDLDFTTDVLFKLELELNKYINSIRISSKAIRKSIYEYPFSVPIEIIKEANKKKIIIAKMISDVGFTIFQLKAHDKYQEEYEKINNTEVK